MDPPVPLVLERPDGSSVAVDEATLEDLDDAIPRLEEKAELHWAKAAKLRRLRDLIDDEGPEGPAAEQQRDPTTLVLTRRGRVSPALRVDAGWFQSFESRCGRSSRSAQYGLLLPDFASPRLTM